MKDVRGVAQTPPPLAWEGLKHQNYSMTPKALSLGKQSKFEINKLLA